MLQASSSSVAAADDFDEDAASLYLVGYPDRIRATIAPAYRPRQRLRRSLRINRRKCRMPHRHVKI